MLLLMMVAISAPPNKRINNGLLEQNIAALGRGEPDAFQAVYEATDRAVFGFILSIVRNAHDAEDIMHDTYLRIYDGASGYQPQGKPMAWIFTIARRLSLMQLRRKVPDDIEALHEEPAAASLTAEAAVDRMVLQTALRVLSEEDRQIVILHASAGMRHREIAAILDLPLSTVLSKYRRALRKLEAAIGEEPQ